ncbi:MAG: hypothetical protein JRI89_06940 [Deltaproteobacteria bacterium]|nr:hypothetical protein [Deltaproteobacteria bacterium]
MPQGIEKALQSLNERLTARALRIWQGERPTASQQNIYEGYEHLLSPEAVLRARKALGNSAMGRRIFHTLVGHSLQYQVAPYENELFTWMKGAAAHINGEKIYFKDILYWCQKRSDTASRRILEKESSSLCKFLKPFALEYWQFFLQLLAEEFGYQNYTSYCKDKKLLDYEHYVTEVRTLLEATSSLYFRAMEQWVERTLGLPLHELNRFDAIYLLGLAEFDIFFPQSPTLPELLAFFDHWHIDVLHTPALHLDIDFSPRKGAQAMSFALRIPDNVYLVMNPQGGWIDVETLFHEMGHALSTVYTSADLSAPEKDFYPSNTLSETYAFLLQNMSLSPYFLRRYFELPEEHIETLSYHKTLKDLAVFRRYAGKFLAEYEMFSSGDMASGEAYARILKEHTGFTYKPETQLFDLAPEFYSLDYLISWMAEATLEGVLVNTLGPEWMFKEAAGELLRKWWSQGNQLELRDFFAHNGLGEIDGRDLLQRWTSVIQSSSP